MKKIKIDFVDFWGGFDKTNNYFYNLLKLNYDVIIDQNPDFIIFSIFGNLNKSYNCKKIFYTGENIAPDLTNCDYSFTFDYLDDPRNFRLPLYILYGGYYDLINKSIDDSLANRRFCNFIVSNGNCKIRNEFFEKLSKYKRVDSGGRFMNNIGFPVRDKVKFQSDYKFSIAFENEAYRFENPGYTTEKIFEPMKVNSIPLYWGNPVIDREFNTKSFVNYYDFNNIDSMVEYIIYLDKNDDEYISMLKEPWLVDNQIPYEYTEDNIKSFLYKIFD